MIAATGKYIYIVTVLFIAFLLVWPIEKPKKSREKLRCQYVDVSLGLSVMFLIALMAVLLLRYSMRKLGTQVWHAGKTVKLGGPK